jgi:NAD(P)-dependent dehydrogenase (short-subunit alcohol dehydrogenase family)
MRLLNKVNVVIGGTSGLGLSAALAFRAAGARIVAVGRNPEKAAAARNELGEENLVLEGDATRPETAEKAIQAALDRFKGFDGLYHVAGGSGRRHGDGPLHEITDGGWNFTMVENLNSIFYSNRAAARRLLSQGKGGSILNMGSVLGFSPSPRYFSTHAYATTKAAIIGLTRSAAAYYASQSIRFNVLAPALVATPMSERAQGNAEILRFISTKQPLDGGRIGQASDLDSAAIYFLSDESKFVTGQVFAVDGGWSVSEGQFPSA